MALPTTELAIALDLEQMSIGDTRLLTGRLNGTDVELIAQFGDFLIAHTNWSASEVDRITVNEMAAVMAKVSEAFKALTVPNSNGASSNGLHD